MSGGNDYSFDAYLNWRGSVDYYSDSSLKKLLRHYAGANWKQADRVAKRISPKASGDWKQCAEIAARPQNHPSLVHFDAHNHRVDRIQRTPETLRMEKEIFGLGLFSDATDPWQKLIQLFLIYQNGEACISCPLTCTEGLVAMLETYADTPELDQIKRSLKDGDNGEFAIGAQYLSEIQGGSDVRANRVNAIQENGEWRIYGKKFFCSAAHADYALLSAKPQGSDQIAAFLVPSWLPGKAEGQPRNGYRIERLKSKMGTCELPTAEIEFDGAIAYPLGPLDKGLANIVGIVLSCSRVTVGIFSAAIMTRAAREAHHYAEFRSAFGRPLVEFPMLASQLAQIELSARRSTAGVFRLTRMIVERDRNRVGAIDSLEARRLALDVRMLIMLQKITTTGDSVETLRRAISVFGGHGVMEDFSVLPRLLRDAMVNELWEGPENVLLAQLHRDMKAAADWYPQEKFVARICGEQSDALASELTDLLACAGLDSQVDGIEEICERWRILCKQLTHKFQQTALEAAGPA